LHSQQIFGSLFASGRSDEHNIAITRTTDAQVHIHHADSRKDGAETSIIVTADSNSCRLPLHHQGKSWMQDIGRKRVVVDYVGPQINGGRFPIKRAIGEKVVVEAHVFSDGHDQIRSELLYKKHKEEKWSVVPMEHRWSDEWFGHFTVLDLGTYCYTVRGWVDHFQTWLQDLRKKIEAGQKIAVELKMGSQFVEQIAKRAPKADAEQLQKWARQLRSARKQGQRTELALSEQLCSLVDKYPDRSLAATYPLELTVIVDRPKAVYSTWYKLFPRSCGKNGKHGTFADCQRLLPEIAKMGFDVLYLSPIHPIGKTNRKGKNNAVVCQRSDPGSPWAIGSPQGGHKSVHPQLGTLRSFQELMKAAQKHGLEVAMDLAFQCSPDHPYVKEHPEWFRWRPDGTVQYAENPPKKYEDILPFNFETEKWRTLWEELKSIVLFWIEQGVRIFRVDNPHTKPFAFWQWLLDEIKSEYPEVIFLSEAFTRPKVMQRLAKIGFNQSYTYFTWRNTKYELEQYLTELIHTEVGQCLRPSFWPNTPDILPQYLQFGGRPAFIVRLVLAATLSASYGIYGPAFELCVSEGIQDKEEYRDAEKYEIKNWDRNRPGHIKPIIERVNRIRKENPSLQSTRNLRFCHIDNDMLLCYYKAADDLSNVTVMVVNLDPHHSQSGWVRLPLRELGIDPNQPYLAHDLISDDKYIWQGESNYVELDPRVMPACILRIRAKLRRETDFDYFM